MEQVVKQPSRPVERDVEQDVERVSDKKQEVVRLYEEGKTLGQIAAKTEIPKSTVSRIIRGYMLESLDPLALRDELIKMRDDFSTYKSQSNERFDVLEHKLEHKISDLEQRNSERFDALERMLRPLVNTFRNLQNPQPRQEPSAQKYAQVEQHGAPKEENPFLKAFDMLDQGLGPLEVMRGLDMDVETVKNVLADWRALREAYEGAAPRDVVIPVVAKVLGENIRDTCDHFNPQSGVCMAWHVTEVDDSLRRNVPGLVKAVGGKARWNVSLHPEVCALCALGHKVRA